MIEPAVGTQVNVPNQFHPVWMILEASLLPVSILTKVRGRGQCLHCIVLRYFSSVGLGAVYWYVPLPKFPSSI